MPFIAGEKNSHHHQCHQAKEIDCLGPVIIHKRFKLINYKGVQGKEICRNKNIMWKRIIRSYHTPEGQESSGR